MKFKDLFLLPLLLVSLIACSKSNNNEPDDSYLRVVDGITAKGEILVGATQTSASFVVEASSTPLVTCSENWVTAKPSPIGPGNNRSKIELTIQPNLDKETPRSCEIRVAVGVWVAKLTLIQNEAGNSDEDQDGSEDDDQGETKTFSPWINPNPCEIGGSNAREVALSLGVGWNLGNQMDAVNNGVAAETAWGNPVATQALFDVLKSKGFSTVRIPVTWLGHIGEAPEYKIDEAWMGRVVELVEMAEKAGLNAVVNIHHDGGKWLDIKAAANDPAKNEETKKEITAVWTQIANAMKDKGNFLMFEAFNEIHDGGWGWGDNRKDGGKQHDTMNQWNQTFVDAVRATGGNNSTRWLGVPSYVTNIDLAVDGIMKLPVDPAGKVMVAVHFYDPNDFALNSTVTDWGHTGENSKKGSWIADEEYIKSQFAKLTNYWVNNGTPVYIGETGPSNQPNARGRAYRNYYLEYMHKAARDAGLAVMYWDNGAVGGGTDKFGLFRHSDGAIINNSEDAIKAMLTGGTCRDEDYTLQTVYDKAPVF